MTGKPPVKLTGLVAGLTAIESKGQGLAPLSFVKENGGNQNDPAVAGRLIHLNIDLIDPSPTPPRVVYTQAAEDELEASIIANGQQEAIHVRPHPNVDGRYIIVDGQTRLNVFRRGNLGKTIRAENHPDMSETDAFWFGFHQNKDRTPPTDIDLGLTLHRMIQTGMATSQVDLCEKSGIKPAAMSALMAYADMPSELLTSIMNSANPGKISYPVASIIRALLNSEGATTEMALEFVGKVIDHDLSQKEAMALKNAMVKAIKPQQKRGRKAAPPFATFGHYGELTTRKDTLSLSLKGLPTEKVEAVARAIKATLDGAL